MAQTQTRTDELAQMLPPMAGAENAVQQAMAISPKPTPVKPEPKHYPARIAKAMIAVTQEIGLIQKTGFNDFQRYKYTTWEAINEKLSPLLADNGLMIIQAEVSRDLIEQNDKGSTLAIVYEFTITNEHGDQWPPIPWTGFARLRDSKGVTDDKAGPKCATQAEKYFCIKTFKIRTTDAIDNDAGDGEISRLPKKDSTQLYKTMQQEIDDARSVVELQAWGKAAAQRSKVLPADWLAHLRLRYNERMADLEASQQTETWDDETGELPPSPPANLATQRAAPPASEGPKPTSDAGELSDKVKSWDELSYPEQAGILCNEAAFCKFLGEKRGAPLSSQPSLTAAAATIVRQYCIVQSRADIRPNHASGKLWRELVADYRNWQTQ